VKLCYEIGSAIVIGILLASIANLIRYPLFLVITSYTLGYIYGYIYHIFIQTLDEAHTEE